MAKQERAGTTPGPRGTPREDPRDSRRPRWVNPNGLASEATQGPGERQPNAADADATQEPGKRWTQDTRWGPVVGGGPKAEPAPESPIEKKLERKVRDDLLPRDRKKFYGFNHGRRDMRRRKPNKRRLARQEQAKLND